MQDLSEKVQKVASSFFSNRNDETFTKFYNLLLPEANKMLRAFLKDSQTIEDISSKIFETILIKPSVYLGEDQQQQFMEIAARFYGITVDQVEFFRKEEAVSVFEVNTIDSNITPDTTKSIKDNGSWLSGKAKKIKIEIFYAPKEGIEPKYHRNDKISYSNMGKIWLLIYRAEKYKVFADNESNKVEITLTKNKLPYLNLSDLSGGVTPFIYNIDKPFLHYFSRIVKTNALSHIKKAKKHQENQFSDMYSGFDDDDQPQLIANQLSDEGDRVEKMNSEHNEQLDNQKFMIVFDIIQNTVPENQRDIMIDAILNKLDYKQIAAKHKLHTVGCIKSRVHRFKKRLDQEIAKTPHFTSQVNLGVYETFFSGGQVRMRVDVCEPHDDRGVMHTLWHGNFVSYYSTGEVKEVGRYYLNKKQSNWYQFYKSGRIMKRGAYQQDKAEGVWHHFDEDGKLNSKINHLTGYYEVHQENGEIVSGIKDSQVLPVKERKTSIDDTHAAKLCLKYDRELSYPSLRFEI